MHQDSKHPLALVKPVTTAQAELLRRTQLTETLVRSLRYLFYFFFILCLDLASICLRRFVLTTDLQVELLHNIILKTTTRR